MEQNRVYGEMARLHIFFGGVEWKTICWMEKKTRNLLVGRRCLTDLMQLRFYLTLTNGCAIRGEMLMENGVIAGASLFGQPNTRCCVNGGEGEGEDGSEDEGDS